MLVVRQGRATPTISIILIIIPRQGARVPLLLLMILAVEAAMETVGAAADATAAASVAALVRRVWRIFKRSLRHCRPPASERWVGCRGGGSSAAANNS